MRPQDYTYHLEMTLNTLKKFKFPNGTDTRNYLDVDADECKILIDLVEKELKDRWLWALEASYRN